MKDPIESTPSEKFIRDILAPDVAKRMNIPFNMALSNLQKAFGIPVRQKSGRMYQGMKGGK